MYRVLKIRIYPNSKQMNIIQDTLNACRFVRNRYIQYINENGFLPYKKYDKIFNQLKYHDDDIKWITEYGISTKAIKDALKDEDMRWCKYFKSCNSSQKSQKRPTFISKKTSHIKSFFIIKDNIHYDGYGRRCISLPILGKTRITEKHIHLPDIETITSGYISKEGNKYYVSLRYKTDSVKCENDGIKIGIDLGINSYATIAYKSENDITVFSVDHFMFTDKYKRIQNKINNIQKIISTKAEMNYGKLLNEWLDNHQNTELSENYKNIMKGESYNTSNIKKLRYKLQKLETKLVNIRKNFIYELIYNVITRAKYPLKVPKYITIEDLSIKSMLKNEPYMNNNHKLHDFISNSGWYFFSQKLKSVCQLFLCELRIADRYFASSKTCCKCGNKINSLTLSDRTFKCDKCGNIIDRDDNAAINLVNTDKYIIYEY